MSLHTAALGLGTGGGFSGSSEATSGITTTGGRRSVFNVFGGSGKGGSASLSEGDGMNTWLLIGLAVIAVIMLVKK